MKDRDGGRKSFEKLTLTKPQSMTYVTLGIVTLASAMLVATKHFLLPLGAG